MKRIDFLRDASEELEDAASYYESQREGLGGEFPEEFERVALEICEHPRRFPK